LYCLACCALQEIVEAGDHDQAFAVFGEREAEVTEIGANYVLDLWKVRCGVKPDQGAVLVEALEDFGDCRRFRFVFEAKIDRGQDAARYG